MLNLNAMFGSCESIFGTEVPRRKNESVSSTELQMMEMEITTDLAQAEVDSVKVFATMSQLDQVFNMYNHVKRFGIDRTFLSLYNSNNQLSSMLGVKFPSCESVDSEGYPGSNMSKVFLAAMEDANEGIFAKIIKGIKWVWEKIKYLCTVVWKKIKSWIGLGTKKNKVILDEAAKAVRNGTRPKSIKRIITKKRVAATIAVITASILAIRVYKKYGKKNTSSSESSEIKNAETNLKNTNDTLTKIKQEEKTETIDNPTQSQMESIIKDSKDANTQMEELSGTIDKVEKELETEAKIVGNGFSDPLPSNTREYINKDTELAGYYDSAKQWKEQADKDKKLFLEEQKILKEYGSLATLTNKQSVELEFAREHIEKRKEDYAFDIKRVNANIGFINDEFKRRGRREKLQPMPSEDL